MTQEGLRVNDNYICPNLIDVVVKSHDVQNRFSYTKVVSCAWTDKQRDKRKLTGKLFAIFLNFK